MLNFRAVKGLLYIHIKLEEISLSKQLFLHELSQGSEVYIPKNLSSKNLSMSFRFYDFLLVFIQKNIKEGEKMKQILQNYYRL